MVEAVCSGRTAKAGPEGALMQALDRLPVIPLKFHNHALGALDNPFQ